MKITDVRTILLTGPCTLDPFISEVRHLRSAAFVQIHTDTEHTGVGETYIGYFFPEGVAPIVDFFKPILVGQTVDDIPALWARMYHCGNFWCRVGLGASVLNGIEAALWDLRGKAEGVPVYELLGGESKHQRLPAYATGGPSNYPKDRFAAKIDYYLSLGFRGVKFGAGRLVDGVRFVIDEDPAAAADVEADKLAFLREKYGGDLRIMLDGHMGNSPAGVWSFDAALAVARALEPYDLFFLEEPLHYTDPDGYAELCRRTTLPIAGGECLTCTYEWRVFTDRDCFDIGQPDASFTGGLDQFMRVAAMLEDRGRKIATHAWGAGGSLMQNVHCGFACANTAILEVAPAYGPLHSEILGDSFRMAGGDVLPPDAPGLGITLTDEVIRRYPFIPGTGEFNPVPGKLMPEQLAKLAAV